MGATSLPNDGPAGSAQALSSAHRILKSLSPSGAPRPATNGQLGAELVEVLERRQDDAIDLALRNAGSDADRDRIRRRAEFVAEIGGHQAAGLACARLFAVPILLTFPEAVPETVLNVTLAQAQIVAAAASQARRVTGQSTVVLGPAIYGERDVLRWKLSEIFSAARAAKRAPDGNVSTLALPHDVRPVRLARSHVRFVAGLAAQGADEIATLALPALRLACRREFERALRTSAFDAVLTVGAPRWLHETIQRGAWAYQGVRLTEIASAERRVTRRKAVQAEVSIEGDDARFEAVLIANGHAADDSPPLGYRLLTRTGESIRPYGIRLRRHLSRAGFAKVAYHQQRLATRAGRASAPFPARVVVPI